MYWTSHLGGNIGNLDAILEKGAAGLDELLDLDNIILKTRNGDERLVGYLTKDKVLGRLIEYATGAGLTGDKAMRFPLIATEILCCEQPPVWQAIQRQPEVLAPVWRLPQTMAPFLVCWPRLVTHLIVRMPTATGESLKRTPSFLREAVHHLSIPEVSDVLFKVMSLMTGSAEDKSPLMLHWMLTEERFVERIFARLDVTGDGDPGALMAVQNFVGGLLGFAGYPEEFPLVTVVRALIKEIDPLLGRVSLEEPDKAQFVVVVEIVGMIIDKVVQRRGEPRWSALPELLSTALLRHVRGFHGLLAPMGVLPKYPSPAGPINPVGIFRLKAAKFFADISRLGVPGLVATMLALGTELFFLHPHNNLLHSEVTAFIQSVFTGAFATHQALIVSTFKDARLTTRIVKAQRVNDAAMQRPRGNRLNYMGHITLISDEIFGLLERHGGELEEILQVELLHEDWLEYKEVAYRETKGRDAIVLGGSRAPPPPSEDIMPTASFTGMFAGGTDEQLARYFCQQVIANLPNRFIFTDEDSDEETWNEEGLFERPSIEIPMEPNGMDDLVEMEMRFSALGDLPDGGTEDDEDEDSGDAASKDAEETENGPEIIEWTPRRSAGQGK